MDDVVEWTRVEPDFTLAEPFLIQEDVAIIDWMHQKRHATTYDTAGTISKKEIGGELSNVSAKELTVFDRTFVKSLRVTMSGPQGK